MAVERGLWSAKVSEAVLDDRHQIVRRLAKDSQAEACFIFGRELLIIFFNTSFYCV